MKPSPFRPVHVLAVMLAGWMNRHQQHAIEYLREENRVLRELLGPRRLRFTDAQRRRLAMKGRKLGRALLRGIATLASPDVILAWHRNLVARKWAFPSRRPRRAEAMKAITIHLLRLAKENPTWGYDRLQGALTNLGHKVSASTLRTILIKNGIPPAPERGRRTPWRRFLKTHASTLFAADFFTTEVWTWRGLTTVYTLFAIDHRTRAVEILGSTVNPCEGFMMQMARNITGAGRLSNMIRCRLLSCWGLILERFWRRSRPSRIRYRNINLQVYCVIAGWIWWIA